MVKEKRISKSLVFYILVSIFFMLGFYFVSVTQTIIDTQDIYTNKVFKEAKDNNSFDEFLAIQIPKYKLNKIIKEPDYTFHYYDGFTNDKDKIVIVIISPNNNKIKIAENLDDLNDRTNLIVKDNNDIIFDPLSSSKALSYGYNDHKIGFMFFDIISNNRTKLNFSYYDYDGNLISNEDILVNQSNFDDSNENDYKSGYTTEELKNNMNLNDALKKSLTIRITIALTIIILLPFLFKLVKRLFV